MVPPLAPLIYLNSYSKLTLSLALASFQSACNCTEWNRFMDDSLVVAIVPILLCFVGQRFLVSGIVVTAK